MSIFQNLMNLFKAKVDTDTIRDPLPFVHVFGHEKSQGQQQPQEFEKLVASYKSWVYACAWKNATSVAKNKMVLYKKRIVGDEEKLDIVTDHPFVDVLTNVNPFSNLFELWTITQLNLELTGNGYWWIPRNAIGLPYMIWNLPSHWMRIVPSETNFIDGYTMRVPGKGTLVPFDENEIIHFKDPSPFDMFYGTGPTWAAWQSIALNDNVKNWGINYFLNNAQPSGVLMTQDSLSTQQYHRLRDMWNSRYRGSKNAGKIALLESGLKYEKIGSTAKEARVEPISKEIRDEILSMYGVPASKLGLVEDVNRANAEANDYTYTKDTILPKLILIEEKVNEKFIPIYDTTLIAKFVDPVPQDKEFNLRRREANIRMGFSTIDEERSIEGLDPFDLPETSAPLIPFNLQPAGSPTEPMPVIDEEKAVTKATDESRTKKWEMFAIVTSPLEKILAARLQRFFIAQQKIVMEKLNQLKSVKKDKPYVTKDLMESIMFSFKEANDNLKIRSENIVRQSYVTGLELGMSDTGTTIDMDMFAPNIQKAVEQRMSFFVGRVNSGTEALLQEAIDTGLKLGESIDDISRRIDRVFSYSHDFRSKRISRTEVIGATNSGQLTSYDEAGVNRKEWLTARDERVRDSHQIDGQVVDLYQPFTTNSGVSLGYPGDRSGGAPASEIINCRCTVNPIV